jgi:hypothetical protein
MYMYLYMYRSDSTAGTTGDMSPGSSPSKANGTYIPYLHNIDEIIVDYSFKLHANVHALGIE